MKPILDRIDFRAQQRLGRADLAQASQRWFDLLALHTARGHDVWGVAGGYGCELADGDTSLVVQPGVAFDRCGRPLLNPQKRVVPLPAVPADGRAYVVDLVARWASTAELPESCLPRNMPAERVHLRWEIAGHAAADQLGAPPYSRRVRIGTDVPIARLTTATTKAVAKVDTKSRPVAHALVRPKIASGRVLQSTVEAQGSYADWHMTVSTTSAGFDPNSSPVYLVSLDAHPFGDTASLGSDTGTGSAKLPDLATRLRTWTGPLVSIESKGHDFFVVRVVTATGAGWGYNTQPQTNPVPLSWTGIATPEPGPVNWSWWQVVVGLQPWVVIR
ncbi:MAG TPA: hypothetical protein VH496_01980 [Mycobacterium sp.]|jgi:hypothetical protein